MKNKNKNDSHEMPSLIFSEKIPNQTVVCCSFDKHYKGYRLPFSCGKLNMFVFIDRCQHLVFCNFLLLFIYSIFYFYQFSSRKHTYIILTPFNPTFIYIVKLGFTGIYIIFSFLLKNIDCGYSLEPSRRGGSNEYLQFMF